MENRETARMRKYGESKTTRIMMAPVPHVTSSLGLRNLENFRPMDFCWHGCTKIMIQITQLNFVTSCHKT